MSSNEHPTNNFKLGSMIIPYGCQYLDQNDINAVIDTLNSDFITQGPQVTAFEDKLKEYTGAKYATVVSNGSVALQLVCAGLGLGPGDILWTTPNSFVASANCALHCGADVDFVDIDPSTYNICPSKLEHKLKQASKRPKIVMVVHFAGQPCDMAAINTLAQKYEFKVIEDGAQALGANYNNESTKELTGACNYSDACTFSFHPVKTITTGEGGAITTNSKQLWENLEMLRHSGITKNKNKLKYYNQVSSSNLDQDSNPPWYYEVQQLSSNYRLNDIACSLGLAQMQKIDLFLQKRTQIAHKYQQNLQDIVEMQHQPSYQNSANHLFVIGVKNRTYVYNHLIKNNIRAGVHFIPIHTHPLYQNLGFKWGDFPVAESYYSKTISLPIFAQLSTQQQDYVIESVQNALRNAQKNDHSQGINHYG